MACKILVVDDEKPILFALREYFSLLGYQVHCAPGLDDAKALLAEVSYAVVIVDLRLSGGDSAEGLDLIEYVRARCPETGVLVLTAYRNPSIELEALSRGADVLLHKPMPLPDLADSVAKVLGTRAC